MAHTVGQKTIFFGERLKMMKFALVVLLVAFAVIEANGGKAKMIKDYELDTMVAADKCTTMITGKTAGKHGPMTTHTADCADCDFRMNRMPAMDHPVGTQRKLYEYKGNYPATLTSDRGPGWLPSNLEGSPEQLKEWGTESKLIPKTIPQVSPPYK